MNLNTVFGELEKVDPEVYDRLNTRRSAMRRFANLSGKMALAAVPLAIGSMFKQAYAGNNSTTETVIQVLQYALTLEYLEAAFYVKGLAEAPIPPGASRTAIQTISNHETLHVAFLRTAITSLGAQPGTSPNFDFTAKGTFPTVFSDYNTFLAVAQTFEDTGVRAYKGRAAELVKGGDLLTAALNIHSVEARHASHIRQMRRALTPSVDVKPWITNEISGVGAAVNASYAGEANTMQATIQIVSINSMAITVEDATEAFDEGLTRDQVLAIVTPFFA